MLGDSMVLSAAEPQLLQLLHPDVDDLITVMPPGIHLLWACKALIMVAVNKILMTGG